jgi:L-ascorbate metabolism protein UlaG (beta-lactamase superfamily)
MKALLILITLVVIGVLGFYAFNNYIYQQKQGETVMDNTSQQNTSTAMETFQVTPVSHASMVITIGGQVIYNDPVGGEEAFAGNLPPNIILISDIHGDHLDEDTLKAVTTEETVVVMPQAVADIIGDNMPGTQVILANGQTITKNGISIEGVPMYNVPERPDSRHTKGRGNGYILTVSGQKVYIAGDTGPSEEMKNLKDIDVAFIPMNPPYTMSVEEAAQAVIAFKPKLVHPYHYRGEAGLSDINKFKSLVEAGDPNIKVELLEYYPEK